MANKVGRPPRKPQSPQSLQQQAREGMQRTQARQVGRESLDIKEFCEKVDGITHRNKFTKEELLQLHQTVNVLYREFVTSQWEAEEQTSTNECLKAIANDGVVDINSIQMTPEEWNANHGLRKNGKGLKPGPAKQKPKNVYDIEVIPGEPIDWKAIEVEWMEHAIVRQAAEVKPLVGKRLRNDREPDLKTKTEQRSFWI